MRNQYSQYERLPVLLKRFSFEEKMSIASKYSGNVIVFTKEMRNSDKPPTVFPWCLETFVMLAMEAEEYKEESFSGKNEKKFLEMCNAIWDATSVATQTPCGRLGFLDTFLAVTGLTQFRYQEIRTIQQYRYWKVLREKTDSVQMDTVFRQRMGTDYEDFLLLGSILQILFLAQSKNKSIVIPRKLCIICCIFVFLKRRRS